MDGKELLKIINNFKESQLYKNMVDGENYYAGKNDILNRKFKMYDVAGSKIDDTYRSNIKTPSNFLQPIIDHKVSYCFAKKIIIENFNSIVLDVNDEIMNVAEEASKTSIGWLYIYIDQFQQIKQKTMESKTIIPIYDGTIENNLINVIRFYKLNDVEKAEVWDSNEQIIFENNDGTEYKEVERISHDWGIIPFVPFYNNKIGTNDLINIKPLIDAYDIILSDFNNNFIDFQEVIILLKNYAENVSTPQAAVEIMEWFKKYKIINVKSDGSLEIISKEVPYQARKELISILNKLIHKMSQSVDLEELKGGSLTNVVIKAYFIFFDLKCNKFINEAKRFIKDILAFSNKYNQSKGAAIDNIIGVNIKFNKSILINEYELVQKLVLLNGLISRRTFLGLLPFIDDVDLELKQMDEDLLNDNNNDLTGGGSNENDPTQ